MRRIIFTILSAFFLAFSNLAFAEDIKICSAQNIILAPKSEYLFEKIDRYSLRIWGVDCLLGRRCEARSVAFGGGLGFDQVVPSADGRWIYALSRDLADGLPSQRVVISRVGVQACWAKVEFCKFEKVFDFSSLARPLISYFTVYPDEFSHGYDRLSAKLSAAYEAARPFVSAGFGINARNVFGVIDGNNQKFLVRADNFDVTAHSLNSRSRPLGRIGHTIGAETGNVTFYFGERGDLYFDASGSVISVDDVGRLSIVSNEGPWASLVRNVASGEYLGYHTRKGVFLTNSRSLSRSVNHTIEEYSIVYIQSIDVDTESNSYLVKDTSTVGVLDPSEGRPISYTYAGVKGRGRVDCGKGKAFDYKIRKEGGVWVSSFIVNPQGKTVVMLHGGPSMYLDTSSSEVVSLLSGGLNVDSIEYGGASFTFPLANRLAQKGYKSLDEDARDVSKYLSGLSKKSVVFLYVSSFGGHIYHRLSDPTLRRFDRIVLDLPAGTISADLNRSNEVVYSKYEAVVGRQIIENEYDNKDYIEQKGCSAVGKTLILYGKDDNVVSPRFDFRDCFGVRGVEFKESEIYHGSEKMGDDLPGKIEHHYKYILDFFKTDAR